MFQRFCVSSAMRSLAFRESEKQSIITPPKQTSFHSFAPGFQHRPIGTRLPLAGIGGI